MRFVSVRDLRGKSAQVWRYVAAEKELVITSKGRPVALLSAISGENLEESLSALRKARAIQAVESMQLASKKAGLDRLSVKEIEAEIKAVRKARAA